MKNFALAPRLSDTEVSFLVALSSWAMLFGTFILSFVLARIKTPIWPPLAIAEFPIMLPLISTFVLLVSSVLIKKGYKAQVEKNLVDFKFFWGLGILLGLFFTLLQILSLMKWFAMGVDFRSHVYASSISFLIAFHALHLTIGLGGLSWKFFRPGKLQSTKLWAWFWHFMDVVWIAMFMVIAL